MAPKFYGIDWSPPVRAVLLTEKALGINLDFVHTDLMSAAHLTPEFLKLNPQHTVPTLVDDGTAIGDSHAIMSYLVGKYGKTDSLYPKNLAERALVDTRLYFECGCVFAVLKRIVVSLRLHGAKGPSDEAVEASNSAYNFLNTFLEGEQWVAGKQLTIADFSLISSILSLNVLVPIDAKYTNVLKWIKRLEQLPYYDANAAGLKKFEGFIKGLILANK